MKIIHVKAEAPAEAKMANKKDIKIQAARVWIAQQNAKAAKAAEKIYSKKMEEITKILALQSFESHDQI
jgi:hypothetical protein